MLNYHRIGNSSEDPFDPDLFSATADELDAQIAVLKRRVDLITLDEAQAFVSGALPPGKPRCLALITFDDGYLDNYQLAFPVLRAHGVQGIFFLASGLVGSCTVPWWDRIAFIMKSARNRRFSLRYPTELTVDLDQDGLLASLRAILDSYKGPANTEPERFIGELKAEAKGDDPTMSVRRFLSWTEAREMVDGGMAVGSHTHSHSVLSQLGVGQQREELERSAELLRENLAVRPTSVAYPVGAQTSFSAETQAIARDCGYQMAFSFYGGTNSPGQTNPYDIRRIAVGSQSHARFAVQCAMCRVTGRYWP